MFTGRFTPRTFVVLFVWLALAIGCASFRQVKLSDQDSGNQVQIQRGQIVAVALESNITTGYRWEMAKSEQDVVQQVGEAKFEAGSKLLGAGGVETLRFRAVKAGEADLQLVYHRSWEDKEPEKVFTCRVVVR